MKQCVFLKEIIESDQLFSLNVSLIFSSMFDPR